MELKMTIDNNRPDGIIIEGVGMNPVTLLERFSELYQSAMSQGSGVPINFGVKKVKRPVAATKAKRKHAGPTR